MRVTCAQTGRNLLALSVLGWVAATAQAEPGHAPGNAAAAQNRQTQHQIAQAQHRETQRQNAFTARQTRQFEEHQRAEALRAQKEGARNAALSVKFAEAERRRLDRLAAESARLAQFQNDQLLRSLAEEKQRRDEYNRQLDEDAALQRLRNRR